MHWAGWLLAGYAAVGAVVLAASLTHPDTLVIARLVANVPRVSVWTGLNSASRWPGMPPPPTPSNGTELRRVQAQAWAATHPFWRWFYGLENGVSIVEKRMRMTQ